MKMTDFLYYASDAWAKMFGVEGTASGRSHCGIDLPDGGRLYFEYREGRSHG